MTFYQELQLNQAGSKNLLKKSKTLKEKLYHMWAVSYTHLDVYKRQHFSKVLANAKIFGGHHSVNLILVASAKSP